jgi:microcystin-dependent protein
MEQYLSEIRIFSFNFAPKYWAFCNGQLLAIAQNQALFSLLGTTFGGNGTTNFALPNLQGRVPMHFGNGMVMGQTAGEANHTLIMTEMPSHNHVAIGSTAGPTSPTPAGNTWASNTGASPYSATGGSLMDPTAIATNGSNQPHNNMSPYLTLNFCIALQGIFPSRS